MSKSMRVVGITVAVVGIIFISIGFYKKGVYEKPGWSNDYEVKNVYVGGDAYNYCINGAYFAGYSALGGAFIVVGGILFVTGVVCDELEALKKIILVEFMMAQLIPF